MIVFTNTVKGYNYGNIFCCMKDEFYLCRMDSNTWAKSEIRFYYFYIYKLYYCCYRSKIVNLWSVYDYNQPVGLKMNLENRCVKKAETIPWDAIEEKYTRLFSSKTGMRAKTLGSLLIQKQLGFS